MIGVPGTADRLFGALREAGISVMLISQGSSEHSICFAVREQSADQVRKVVERAFAAELQEGQVQRVEVTKGCGILAVVGDDMAGLPGSAGRFFRTLGTGGHQRARDRARGVRAQHFSRDRREGHDPRSARGAQQLLFVGEDGLDRRDRTGLGRRRVARSARERRFASLRSKFNLDLRVRAIGGSKRMLLDNHHIELAEWRKHACRGGRNALDAVRRSRADGLSCRTRC